MTKPFLFEVSWEVCNKVGGIYTVLKSKAGHMKAHFKENYLLVGPYFSEKNQVEFDEKPAPEPFKAIFNKLRERGIICHFGRWLISSSPNVILVDFSGFISNTNDIKARFYERFGIDSLGSDYYDYDEPIVWGVAAAELIDTFKQFNPEAMVVVHCHEWLSAGTGLSLKERGSDAKIVFTTHATVLGRTLAGIDPDFYKKLDNINPNEEARKYGIHTKHQTEAAMAQNSDAFTTVSEITAMEAGAFLGRKPDAILPNGLDLSTFPTFEEISIKHKIFKRRIKEFVEYTIFPYYTFNLEDTVIFFTASRYEFHGKGLDVYIKALGKLDRALTKDHKSKTVVNFFWVPNSGVRGINPEVLESKTYFEDIKESIISELPEIEERLLYRVLAGKKIIKSDLFSEQTLRDLKRKIKRFKKSGSPKLCSHLIDEANDPIMQGFKANNLTNSKENAVKVFLYPIYLTGADGVLDLNYYECIQGCQFGIFPSFYEPWGYTPVEAAALGAITLTTDLSGFGRYVLSNFGDKVNKGIYVLPRFNYDDEKFVDILAKALYKFVTFSRAERIENKMEAKKLSNQCNWSKLITYYFKIYEKVLRR